MSDRSDRIEAARRAFDAAARRYAEQFADELDRKPCDRALLQRFASAVRPDGRVLDIGTGPAGRIGRELAGHGLRVTGVDISAESIAYARSLVPAAEMDFVVGDARALPFDHGSIARTSRSIA